MGRHPDIEAFRSLLHPVDVQGPARFLYAFQEGRVREYLEELRQKDKAAATAYLTAFRMLGMNGHARWEKWHPLDDEKVPKGIAYDSSGRPFSLKGLSEFKYISGQSRIFACNDGEGLLVLLTHYVGKKEDKLTADAVNPACRLREAYMMQKQVLMKGGRKQ